MGYRIRGVSEFRLWCAVVRWYGLPYNGGFVCCDCGVVLCVGMCYRIMGCLCVVNAVCCCASEWGTVY